MKVIKKLTAYIAMLILILGVLPAGHVAEASTPRVMLTAYSFDKDRIYVGDSFTLTFTLQNMSKYEVRNLKCSVISAEGEILPVQNTGTGYIEKLKGEECYDLSFDLETIRGLKEKSYKLTIRTEYEDWNGSYTAEDVIYVPLKLGIDMEISDVYIADEDIHLGDNIEILATVNNSGYGDLYKVKVVVSGDHIEKGVSYLGIIEPGKSKNADIIVATKALKESGQTNDIEVIYSDIDGNEYSKKLALGVIDVKERSYAGLVEVKADTSKPLLTENMKLWLMAGVIVLIVIILMVKRRLRRKKLEDEF